MKKEIYTKNQNLTIEIKIKKVKNVKLRSWVKILLGIISILASLVLVSENNDLAFTINIKIIAIIVLCLNFSIINKYTNLFKGE